LDRSLVKLIAKGGAVAGAGVLVGPRRIATCAHVVNAALGRRLDEVTAPSEGDIVKVVFAADPARTFEAALVDPDGWYAPPRPGAAGRDLCLLSLREAPPRAAAIASVSVQDANLVLKSFRALGYPLGWPEGDTAVGQIVSRVGDFYRLRPTAPLDALVGVAVATMLGRHPPGLVHRGFSGGPVEVEGKVVGLVTSGRRRKVDVTAQMTPLSAIDTRRRRPPQELPSHACERRWCEFNGSQIFGSTAEAIERWVSAAPNRPLVFIDHFEEDLDFTAYEVMSAEATRGWTSSVWTGRLSPQNVFTPFSIVTLEGDGGFDPGRSDLAALASTLWECQEDVIVLCSRPLLANPAFAAVLRGLPWALQAPPLYDRRTPGLEAGDVRDVPLAMHIGARSPALSELARKVQGAGRQKLFAMKEFAAQALARDQLEAAVRAEIAIASFRKARIATHQVRGHSSLADGSVEVYRDVCEVDALVARADLIGPLGSGKSTVLRSIERRLVSDPATNEASDFVRPVWLPLYVEVREAEGAFPSLLEHLRRAVSLGTQEDGAALRRLLSGATSLRDLSTMLSSPILFLFDVGGSQGLSLTKTFIGEVHSALPSAGYLVAHEGVEAPITDHEIRMAPPDLATVTAVLECTEREVVSALSAGQDDAGQVLCNWTLLRLVQSLRRSGEDVRFSSFELVRRQLESLLDGLQLADGRRDAFMEWLAAAAPTASDAEFDRCATRLGLRESAPGTGWFQALLQGYRWQRLAPPERLQAVLSWLALPGRSLEAPTLLLQLLDLGSARDLLRDIARTEPIPALELLNRLPFDRASALDAGELARSALDLARTTTAFEPANAALPPVSILKKLSWRDPRMTLPPELVQVALPSGGTARIAVYPIVRSQFAAFARAGGYGCPDFWQDERFLDHARRANLAGKRLWDLSTRGLPNAPMTDVSMPEAVAFCAWLSAEFGGAYALPTARQWDAAAGINLAAFNASNALTSSRMDGAVIGLRRSAHQGAPETPAGLDAPNAQGCCDMFGLVWEWCDTWAVDPHPSGPPSTATDWAAASVVIRGCPQSVDNLFELISARSAPTVTLSNLGFRVASG